MDKINESVDYEKQIYDLKQLLEISRSLNSTLDFSILIDSILYICMAQMKVTDAALFTRKGLDADCFSLHRNYKGFDIDHSLEYSIPDDHELVRLFSHEYACFTVDEIHQRIGIPEGMEPIEKLNPALIIPLKAKGQINGIIMLGERIDESDFDQHERDYLLNIAILASIAINNAFLFEMTTTDIMTKLKMKHYFFTTLMERFNLDEEEPSPFSLIMIDIDFFKRFNDTYGHSCGDMVLKKVAHTILEHIRPDDLAARYGGEEFVVLLDNSDASRTLTVAERIRCAVEDTVTDYEGLNLQVTISCGVAEYDVELDFTPKSLIDRADKALYHSKQSGRNQVSLAE